VLIDNKTLTEISRVGTGAAPDGDGWDPIDKIVGPATSSSIRCAASSGSPW
jgi:hypothetical protein